MTADDDSALKTPETVAGYADPRERPPFVPYLAFMSVFGSLVSGALLIARGKGASCRRNRARESCCWSAPPPTSSAG